MHLQALTSRTVETAGRNTAGKLDLALRHADSSEFEGEAARLAWAPPVWGPLIVEELGNEAAAGTGAVLIMKGDEVELPRGAKVTVTVTK